MGRITKRKIEKWENLNNIPKLISALEYKSYDIRILAANSLSKFKARISIPNLLDLLDDKIEIVRLAAKEALLEIDSSDSMKNKIKERLEKWEKENEKVKNFNKRVIIDEESYKWEGRFKRKMKWTKHIKEKLKRPMRWG